jgi:hypothetical protein
MWVAEMLFQTCLPWLCFRHSILLHRAILETRGGEVDEGRVHQALGKLYTDAKRTVETHVMCRFKNE